MGSIKGFIDWVKGSELEDDYEDEMPRQRNEEPAMDSEPSSYNRRSQAIPLPYLHIWV